MINGIILCGGKAKMFGGVYKELLPIAPDRVVVDSSIDILKSVCDQIIVVTSVDKIAIHAKHFSQSRYAGIPISLVSQVEDEMFGALRATLPFASTVNHMLMGDTVFSGELKNTVHPHLSFGQFLTFDPSNYSVFDGNRIITKPYPAPYKNMPAWGTVSFSKSVAEFWRGLENMHYDLAFNRAIEKFGYGSYYISGYSDLGTFERYKEYLCR